MGVCGARGYSTKYSWGNATGKNSAKRYDGCGDLFDFTAPMGSLRANAFDLYDMHGNVWAWVEDCRNDRLLVGAAASSLQLQFSHYGEEAFR